MRDGDCITVEFTNPYADDAPLSYSSFDEQTPFTCSVSPNSRSKLIYFYLCSLHQDTVLTVRRSGPRRWWWGSPKTVEVSRLRALQSASHSSMRTPHVQSSLCGWRTMQGAILAKSLSCAVKLQCQLSSRNKSLRRKWVSRALRKRLR